MASEDQYHPATRVMLATARALARNEPPPKAARTEPGLADRLFAFERNAQGEARVQAFAEGLVTLFGRDLRREDFAALFLAPDRKLFLAFLDAIEAAREPAVARCVAETAQAAMLGLEILVSPLDPAIAGPGRLLGLVQPLGGETISGGAIALIRLQALHPPAARAPLRSLRLVVSNA